MNPSSDSRLGGRIRRMTTAGTVISTIPTAGMMKPSRNSRCNANPTAIGTP